MPDVTAAAPSPTGHTEVLEGGTGLKTSTGTVFTTGTMRTGGEALTANGGDERLRQRVEGLISRRTHHEVVLRGDPAVDAADGLQGDCDVALHLSRFDIHDQRGTEQHAKPRDAVGPPLAGLRRAASGEAELWRDRIGQRLDGIPEARSERASRSANSG